MNTVFLLLGSNLGDRHTYLEQAVHHLEKAAGPVIKKSSVYETQSWGKTDQPDYLNQVIIIESDLPARAILQKILKIEVDMGRKREEKWGSRIIDIDILFFNTAIINEPGLHIPHPELHNRRFTLEPLVEIAPDFIHPVLNATIFELKNNLKDSLVVKKL